MRIKDYKIELSTLISISVVLLLIMDYTLFLVIKMPSFVGVYWSSFRKFFPGLICVFLCIMVVYFCPYMINQKSFLPLYLLVISFIIMAIDIYSFVIYRNESLKDIVLTNGHFMYLFLTIPILWLFIREETIYSLLDKINVVMFIWYVIVILQKVLYTYTGTIFIQMDDMLRDGRLRIHLLSFGNLMIIYNFNQFYNRREKNRLFYLAQFLMGMYCLVFIQITRGYMIAVIIGVGCEIIAASTSVKKTAINVAIVVSGLLYFIYSGLFEKILTSLNLLQTGTISVRFEAIQYYWNEFLKSPLWGHGTIVDVNNSVIAGGFHGTYYYSDVGIIGALAQYGLLFVFIFMIPIIHFIRISLRIFMNRVLREKFCFLFGVIAYILVTMPTLIVTDVERIFLFPFCLALFEYADLTSRGIIDDMDLTNEIEKDKIFV